MAWQKDTKGAGADWASAVWQYINFWIPLNDHIGSFVDNYLHISSSFRGYAMDKNAEVWLPVWMAPRTFVTVRQSTFSPGSQRGTDWWLRPKLSVSLNHCNYISVIQLIILYITSTLNNLNIWNLHEFTIDRVGISYSVPCQVFYFHCCLFNNILFYTCHTHLSLFYLFDVWLSFTCGWFLHERARVHQVSIRDQSSYWHVFTYCTFLNHGVQFNQNKSSI